MIRALSRPYACREAAPVLDRVNTTIFRGRYFARCMECGFCRDSCCQWGVDIDAANVLRLEAAAADLEPHVGSHRSAWFTNEWTTDSEMPGGRSTRTEVVAGKCVFLNRMGRGCMLHSFAAGRGADYHTLKPMVCSLFPLTFDGGLLLPAEDVSDGLVCVGQGPSLYRGVREEISWYFGDALVQELDQLEAE